MMASDVRTVEFSMNDSMYYEKYWSTEGFFPRGHTTPELSDLLEKWINPHWKCLDVGCGDGRTSGLWLREHGCDYVGVDVSSNAIEQAIDLGLEAVRIDDAGCLPFKS